MPALLRSDSSFAPSGSWVAPSTHAEATGSYRTASSPTRMRAAAASRKLFRPATPTFPARSSRNRWVAISTNGLLSWIRASAGISALSLDPRTPHDEGVDAFVIAQEGADVVLVAVHLDDVLGGDLRLAAPAAGREEEAGEGVAGDRHVLRDLLPEPFVEDAEIAHRDVVDVLVVLVRHGLIGGAHPADRETRAEDRRHVAALPHRVQVPDDVPIDVRDGHVRQGRHVPLDAEGRAALPDRDVEGRPSEVRLLPHPTREVVADALPELGDALGPGLLDHVLDQGSERDVDHGRPRDMDITRTSRGPASGRRAIPSPPSPRRCPP